MATNEPKVIGYRLRMIFGDWWIYFFNEDGSGGGGLGPFTYKTALEETAKLNIPDLDRAQAMDNEANTGWPVTIGELRAKRSGHAGDWTPKDCLTDMLRAIEEGRINPDGLIVCTYSEGESGGVDIKYSQAMPNIIMASGTLQRVQSLLDGDNRQ